MATSLRNNSALSKSILNIAYLAWWAKLLHAVSFTMCSQRKYYNENMPTIKQTDLSKGIIYFDFVLRNNRA